MASANVSITAKRCIGQHWTTPEREQNPETVPGHTNSSHGKSPNVDLLFPGLQIE